MEAGEFCCAWCFRCTPIQLGQSGSRHCSRVTNVGTLSAEIGDEFGGMIYAVVFSMVHFLFDFINGWIARDRGY